MSMKKGHSQQVVSENIKSLIRSGQKQKHAVAKALANARSSKKMMMAEGGMVEKQDDDKEINPSEILKQKPEGSAKRAKEYSEKINFFAEGGMVEGDSDDLNEGSINVGGDMGEPGMAVYGEGEDSQGLSDNVMLAQALAKGLQAKKMKANDNSVSLPSDGSKMEMSDTMKQDLVSSDAMDEILKRKEKRRYGQYSPR